MVVSLQLQAQGGSDVEALVKMIDSVEGYQKEWNGQRSDQAPTFHLNFLVIRFLYRVYVSPASKRYVLRRGQLDDFWLSHQAVTLGLTILVLFTFIAC